MSDYPPTQAWVDSTRLRWTVIGKNNYNWNSPNLKKGYPENCLRLIRPINPSVINNDPMMLIAGTGDWIDDFDQTDAHRLYLVSNPV
ncbi:MAG: hypothetical protein EKK68_04385 [Candidatus Competibacteraceae bacterium]|nr:MAG: hypothetical protein EKK68_04385 [Candidatus Competibacteraceae bacterium]